MKLFLDDKRPCPKGWVHFIESNTLIEFLSMNWLKTKEVTHMSLGSDGVLSWMEKMINSGQASYLPIIEVHSSNTTERVRMSTLIIKLDQDLWKMQKKPTGKHQKTIKEVFGG